MRVIERADGTRMAEPCVCRSVLRSARLAERARIPRRFADCTLDSFEPGYLGESRSLANAVLQARNFVKAYPYDTAGKGLLFTGPNGVGKTHLAVAMLKGLIEKGAHGLFVTYGDLLKQVQNSYNPTVQQTEMDVLRPVTHVEVLVIDELGSSKPTEWVKDTVDHILNTRYNDMRTTIITTNYANERGLVESDIPNVAADARNAWLAMYKEKLGDRIGERMRSRLHEMCRVVEMAEVASDFREKVKRPSFA
jgi:DNA replication protein DnaC